MNLEFFQFKLDSQNKFAFYSVATPFLFLILTAVTYIFISNGYGNDITELRYFYFILLVGASFILNVFLVLVFIFLSYAKREKRFRLSLLGLGFSLMPIIFIIAFNLYVPIEKEEKDITFLGIDQDMDGVRDDVQEWIEKSFDVNLKSTQYLKSYTMLYQDSLKNVENKNKSIEISHEISRLRSCILKEFKNEGKTDREGRIILSQLGGLFFNTKGRLKGYRKMNENFHGQLIVIKNEEELNCNF